MVKQHVLKQSREDNDAQMFLQHGQDDVAVLRDQAFGMLARFCATQRFVTSQK